MKFEDFEKIQQKTWIRVIPPDDPFYSRAYKVISNVIKLSDEEREEYTSKKTIIAPHFKVYVHTSILFTPEGWAEPGYRIFFPEKVSYISDWDINHATVVKKITRKTYHGILTDVFENKLNYER